MVTIDGFYGPLVVSIRAGNGAQFNIDDGAWTNLPAVIEAGQAVRVRHTSAASIGAATDTTLTVGLQSGASRTSALFHTVTSQPDTLPAPFDSARRQMCPVTPWSNPK